jgi:probable rRNA maturation factor
MRIDVYTDGDVSLPYENITLKQIKSLVQRICNLIKIDADISVILCDNNIIHAINREYRNKNKPTDVISFSYMEYPFPAVESAPEPLGDIYISLEKAMENARSYEVKYSDEIKRLLIHGILHLIGYDHERSPEDERIMQEKEEQIFNQI